MDEQMKKTLQAVLDRVKDPETGLSVAQLGLVQKIRYVKENKKLLVLLTFIRPGPVCCSLLSGMILSAVKKELQTELERAFPELTVEYT
jgi:metal-sulfur cluster biosynthetic enzyme